jgi:hypothetical protein
MVVISRFFFGVKVLLIICIFTSFSFFQGVENRHFCQVPIRSIIEAFDFDSAFSDSSKALNTKSHTFVIATVAERDCQSVAVLALRPVWAKSRLSNSSPFWAS